MTRISVIIPSYNRRDWLMACLDSVAAQRRAPDEVIVVDDGSTDGTPEAVRARKGVTLIEQANAGPGAARNRGAAEATGDYLAFLDSDDLWFPWSLEVMTGLIEKHSQPALLSAQLHNFSGTAPRLKGDIPVEAEFYSDFLSCSDQAIFVNAGMLVVQRKLFLATGGFFEERLNAEDHDLMLRLGTAPGFVRILAPTTLARRMHDSNLVSDIDKSLRGLVKIIKTEKTLGYPGGGVRAAERQTFIGFQVRPVVVAAAKSNNFNSAKALYRRTFMWNLRAGRYSYLAGVPAIALFSWLRTKFR